MVGVVTLDRVADLSEADCAAVRSLSLAVYPPEEWADWPGRHVEWSAPEWCVRVHGGGGACRHRSSPSTRSEVCAVPGPVLV